MDRGYNQSRSDRTVVLVECGVGVGVGMDCKGYRTSNSPILRGIE